MAASIVKGVLFRGSRFVGKTFGRLRVEAVYPPASPSARSTARCKCVCGNEIIARLYAVQSGNTRSCGCLSKEISAKLALKLPRNKSTHKFTLPREYLRWASIKTRCTNPKHRAFSRYGGRGITMCERWRKSFHAFLADMGPAPFPGAQLDRINNDGNYEPGNVRWATRQENLNNTCKTRWLTHNGATHPMSVWAQNTGIPLGTIRSRIRRGWPTERALTTKV